MRKWLERCDIPGDWKVKIFEKTKGKVAFGDMVIIDHRTVQASA